MRWQLITCVLFCVMLWAQVMDVSVCWTITLVGVSLAACGCFLYKRVMEHSMAPNVPGPDSSTPPPFSAAPSEMLGPGLEDGRPCERFFSAYEEDIYTAQRFASTAEEPMDADGVYDVPAEEVGQEWEGFMSFRRSTSRIERVGSPLSWDSDYMQEQHEDVVSLSMSRRYMKRTLRSAGLAM